MKRRWRQIKKSFTEKKIGSARRTEKMDSSGGKSGNGRVMSERRTSVWRVGSHSLNGVKMWMDSARHAMRLSRGGVLSQSKEQMGQDGK